tara:strand:- start:2077 stop:2436 length:360 start_codon:yes stop_codon:yes gene_type:complete
MTADLKLIQGGLSTGNAEKSGIAGTAVPTETTNTLAERLLDLGIEGALVMDGFDDCVVGVLERFGMERVLLYDKDLVIQKLIDDGIDSYEGALEFYEYNQLGGWHGEQTPGFLVWLPEL